MAISILEKNLFIEALKREIMEEFIVEIIVGEPFAPFTYENAIKKSHSCEIVYLATFTDAKPSITLNPEDHGEYRWVSADSLPNIYNEEKGKDDSEYAAIRRGFEILSGDNIKTGS